MFWVTADGAHGLEAAPSDQGGGPVPWYNGTDTVTNAVCDARHCARNTERIIASQGAGNYAAHLAANYTGGSYDDWYLPSQTELNLMYVNIGPGSTTLGNVGQFATDLYWGSTEHDSLQCVGPEALRLR